MFRITFSIDEGEKSYKKDRFVELGAHTLDNAKQWKKELERVIEVIRKKLEGRRESHVFLGAKVGTPPPNVKRMLEDDDDQVSICKQ